MLGLTNRIIFKIIKNIPIVTKQKTRIAKKKKNLKTPSPILFILINYKIFYLHNVNLYTFYPAIHLSSPFLR